MTTVLGRERTADDLAPQAVAGELVHELDMLVRWRQTADGGCFDVFSRRRKVKGPDAARRERWHWQAQRGVVCRVRRDVSICAGAGGAKPQ